MRAILAMLLLVGCSEDGCNSTGRGFGFRVPFKRIGQGGGGGAAFSNTLSTVFGGTNEYGTCGDLAIVDSATALSVCWWFHWSTVPTTGAESHWGKFDALTASSPIHSWFDWAPATDTLAILTRSTSRGVQWTMPAFASNTWYHICAVYDGATPDQHLYYNGSLYTTGKTTITAIQTVLQDGLTNPWVIGARRASDGFSVAHIDEFSVWNDVLSAGNASSLYNSGTPIDCTTISPSCDNWWRMGDGDTFPTLLDGPGTNDCTLTNMESGDIQGEVPP